MSTQKPKCECSQQHKPDSHKVETRERPSPDGWMSKVWYVCTKEYYSVLNKKEVLIHDTTWINPENITLSEGSQT